MALKSVAGFKGSWREMPSERQVRIDFEQSHSYVVGDVILLTRHTDYGGVDLFGSRGTVERVDTDPDTGPCIRVNIGGVGINIWQPQEELCFDSKIGTLLYV